MDMQKTRKPKKPRTLKGAKGRVAVAQDVLKLLKAKKVKARTGSYLGISTSDYEATSKCKDLRGVLRKIKSCEACALGSMLVSVVRKDNDFPMTGDTFCDWLSGGGKILDDEERMRKRLGELFSPEQLALIECAFERRDQFATDDSVPSEIGDAVDFGHGYDTATDRLKAIMQNIIDNKGQFVPPPSQETQLEAEQEEVLV